MTTRDQWLRLADRCQQLQLIIAATALLALMMVTVSDVFMRYVFNAPIRGSYELVESFLLVLVFNAVAAAFYLRRHIVIDIIDSFVGSRATAALVRVADLLSVFCICLIMWAMRVPAVQAFQYGDVKLELSLPIYILWAVAFAGLIGTLFCAIVVMLAKPVTTDVEHI